MARNQLFWGRLSPDEFIVVADKVCADRLLLLVLVLLLLLLLVLLVLLYLLLLPLLLLSSTCCPPSLPLSLTKVISLVTSRLNLKQ